MSLSSQDKTQSVPDLHENAFDYFRIYAALHVLIGHIVLLYNISLPKGADILFNIFKGVPILFTLCGFLVTASYIKSDSIKQYYKKRVFRIFPSLWISVIVGFLVLLYFYRENMPLKSTVIWTIAQGFALQYTPGFAESFGSGTFNGALWALFTELQFYIILPLFYKIMKNKKMRTWILVGIVLLIINILGEHIVSGIDNRVVYLLWRRFLLSKVMYFYIGSFICVFRNEILPKIIRCFSILLLVYVCSNVVNSLIGIGVFYYIFIYCLFPFVLIAGGYCLSTHRLKMDISYGVFLYHCMVLNIFIHLGAKPNLINIVAIILISIACGIVATYIDKKINALMKNVSKSTLSRSK